MSPGNFRLDWPSQMRHVSMDLNDRIIPVLYNLIRSTYQGISLYRCALLVDRSAASDKTVGSLIGHNSSKARATRNTRPSWYLAATICKPTGRPAAVKPHGMEAAGCC